MDWQLLWKIFWVFTKVALFSWGGGPGSMGLMQRETVAAGWVQPDEFADGMALMVPFTGGGNTAIQMGTMSGPVNVIMWRADWLTPHNMVAGGFGTVQTSPDAASQNIVHYQRWASGAWTVIVSRPMAAASVNQVTFTRGAIYSIAFANWEGSDWERNGHKNIYNWGNLSVQ